MMKTYLNTIVAAVGGAISYLVGGFTLSMQVLLILMAIDYITGLIVAGVFHNSKKTSTGGLSSKTGFKGLCKKFVVLLIVVASHEIDAILGINFVRDAVICGYCANELLSIVENAGLMGVPVPTVITNAVDTLKEKENEA